MADGIGLYQITGSVQTTVLQLSSVASSGAIGSLAGVNNRRLETRQLYTSFLTSSDPPSWTQHFIGKKHAFVLTPMSASYEEYYSWNVFLSGS